MLNHIREEKGSNELKVPWGEEAEAYKSQIEEERQQISSFCKEGLKSADKGSTNVPKAHHLDANEMKTDGNGVTIETLKENEHRTENLGASDRETENSTEEENLASFHTQISAPVSSTTKNNKSRKRMNIPRKPNGINKVRSSSAVDLCSSIKYFVIYKRTNKFTFDRDKQFTVGNKTYCNISIPEQGKDKETVVPQDQFSKNNMPRYIPAPS
mmetsp:Transcript_18801/g.37443  ORF Transcript_18801/g.37443 Transcript_18801/m.37443 type:complete len:213 (+) Transcript_18801:261-899(+)|eukprot:CAMPEP_0194350886 /NCGR_PEP_ID=MMETSP0171-20130528/107879_1 /TAXON_ID=218684 /ORGANISM="Corethron pennatum, Strain L29A3" /LENGTH=212 /DNA_ID=CAMNT_0039118469 /DNA_START=849 /DNA_END=1487 /DNA_ORIENTATION=+